MKILLSLILVAAMQAAKPSPVQIVARDMMSMVDEPQQAVARSAAEWASLWRQHAGDKAPPAVDFGSRTVVAVFLGSRSSAGFAVDITAVREAGGALIVEWQERRPEKGQVSAQVLTSPAVIATVAKFAGEIKFEKVER
jgi:PrcB C-terminal